MKKKLSIIILNVVLVLLAVTTLKKGMNTGETWRVVFASVGVLVFSLFTSLLLRKTKIENNQ